MVRIREENINTKEFWDEAHDKRNQNNHIDKQIKRFFEQGFLPTNESISVLDVGCGLPLHFSRLKNEYPLVEWYGLDLSEIPFDKANVPKSQRIVLDVDKEDVPGEYDYVISMHSFEHFDNPDKVKDKCLSVARKKVIILVPYLDAWSGCPEHVHKFEINDPFNDYSEYRVLGEEIFFVFEGKAK